MSAAIFQFPERSSDNVPSDAAALDNAIWRVIDPITRTMDDEAIANLEFPLRAMLSAVARRFGHLTVGDVCGLLEHRTATLGAHAGSRRYSATDCLVGCMEQFAYEAPARSARDMIARARWAQHERSIFGQQLDDGDAMMRRGFLRIVDDLLCACPETAAWQNDDPAATLAGWWAKNCEDY